MLTELLMLLGDLALIIKGGDFVLGGAAAVIQTVGMDRFTQLFNFPALLVSMAILVVMCWPGRSVTRREGVVLLTVYGFYIAALTGVSLVLTK